VKETSDYRDKPQVPPLRFAPVGMTILLQGARYPLDLSVTNRIVIPTGAKRSGGTCGFLSRNLLCGAFSLCRLWGGRSLFVLLLP
jgi:hypothetical protein